MAQVFFGYPSQPSGPGDVMRTTSERLAEQGITTQTWQDLKIAGRVVVSSVLKAIDDAQSCIFDLTVVNSNVVFELAYAIAKGKSVRITLDKTVASAVSEFNELSTLKPLGYTAYFNSNDLSAGLLAERPWDDTTTAYDDFLEPVLAEDGAPKDSLLYCPTYDPFEASSRLNSFIDERQTRGTRVKVYDPKESSFEPITWLGPTLMGSAGVLVHFAGEHRSRAQVINARHAITAGFALGLEIPVLMLAEPEYKAPFDYETLLRTYRYPRECVHLARTWLDGVHFEGVDWRRPRRSPRNPLVALKFGEHVAENEADELPEYFVETSAFHDVLQTRDTIFVGHRGTGKTANALQALDRLRANKTNLAVLIKPPGFEFPAMFEAMMSLPTGQHDYFFDALWRFVIQTEMGAAILQRIESRGPHIPLSNDEQNFVDYAASAPFDLRSDISSRLEQTLMHLSQRVSTEDSSSPRRNLINEASHADALSRLRAALGVVLKSEKRVAILVDNLDKGWDRNSDLNHMARFILGLLVARGNVLRDFDKQSWWRDRVRLTVSIFLRSDIYHYLRTEAREPDKLPLSTVKWKDPQTLLHVLESRFEAKSRGKSGDAMWGELFDLGPGGEQAIKDCLTGCVQPRPRDILVLINAAVSSAIDRGHLKVSADDMQIARRAYSDYAFDALLVENGVTVPELKQGLLSLLGVAPVLTVQEATEQFANAGINDDRVAAVIEKLVSVSFFGVEVHENAFEYPEVGTDMDRAQILAAKLQSVEGQRRLKIHDAYHPFLEVVEDAQPRA